MADGSSSGDSALASAWRAVRTMILGRDPDATLRDQIEEAIEDGGDQRLIGTNLPHESRLRQKSP